MRIATCTLVAWVVALVVGGGWLGTAWAAGVPAGMSEAHVFHEENVLGTSLDVKVLVTGRGAGDAVAERAEAAALAEFDREAGILSAWSEGSEFSRWTRTRGVAVRVSPELFEVLGLFDAWRVKTGGAVDASAEAAVRVWKAAAAEGRTPTAAELRGAVAEMQRPHWVLDRAARTATHLDDAPIALNSFAKSYIAARAADAAMRAGAAGGVLGVILNVGGDIVLCGDVTERVAIANPRADAENDAPVDLVRVASGLGAGRTIATSGSYRRGVDVGGAHYSHIVDPRTGAAMDRVLSSTVVAEDAAEAGALATAFSVMAPEESAALAKRMGGVEYLILLRDGGRVESAGWAGLEVAGAGKARVVEARFSAPKAVAAGPKPPAPMDLLVTLELAKIDNPRYHRPYVAVWVEDEKKAPVRAISLWSQKPRYLDELRNWYKDYPGGTMNGAEVSPSLSSATRPAGKYTLRWDGRDDKGNAVKPGKYTVLVEAAREHGGYDLMKQEINVDGKTAAQFTLPEGHEIAGVQMDYGKHGE